MNKIFFESSSSWTSIIMVFIIWVCCSCQTESKQKPQKVELTQAERMAKKCAEWEEQIASEAFVSCLCPDSTYMASAHYYDKKKQIVGDIDVRVKIVDCALNVIIFEDNTDLVIYPSAYISSLGNTRAVYGEIFMEISIPDFQDYYSSELSDYADEYAEEYAEEYINDQEPDYP